MILVFGEGVGVGKRGWGVKNVAIVMIVVAIADFLFVFPHE